MAALFTGITLALSITSANAAVLLTLAEENGNVVATGNGSFNLNDLTLLGTTFDATGVNPSAGFLEVSQTLGSIVKERYGNNIIGPSSFGSGGFVFGYGKGDAFGIRGEELTVTVPAGYVSGTNLSGSWTMNGTNFESLGVTPGTYVWTWGSGQNADSLTLMIPPPRIQPIPTLSSWALALMAGLLCLLGLIRRRV